MQLACVFKFILGNSLAKPAASATWTANKITFEKVPRRVLLQYLAAPDEKMTSAKIRPADGDEQQEQEQRTTDLTASYAQRRRNGYSGPEYQQQPGLRRQSIAASLCGITLAVALVVTVGVISWLNEDA